MPTGHPKAKRSVQKSHRGNRRRRRPLATTTAYTFRHQHQRARGAESVFKWRNASTRPLIHSRQDGVHSTVATIVDVVWIVRQGNPAGRPMWHQSLSPPWNRRQKQNHPRRNQPRQDRPRQNHQGPNRRQKPRRKQKQRKHHQRIPTTTSTVKTPEEWQSRKLTPPAGVCRLPRADARSIPDRTLVPVCWHRTASMLPRESIQ